MKKRVWMGLSLSILLLSLGFSLTTYRATPTGRLPSTVQHFGSIERQDLLLHQLVTNTVTISSPSPLLRKPPPDQINALLIPLRSTPIVRLTPTTSPTALVFPSRKLEGSLLDRMVAYKPWPWGSRAFYGLVALVYGILVALLLKQVLRMES